MLAGLQHLCSHSLFCISRFASRLQWFSDSYYCDHGRAISLPIHHRKSSSTQLYLLFKSFHLLICISWQFSSWLQSISQKVIVILTDNLFLVDLNMQLKVWEVAQSDNVQLFKNLSEITKSKGKFQGKHQQYLLIFRRDVPWT